MGLWPSADDVLVASMRATVMASALQGLSWEETPGKEPRIAGGPQFESLSFQGTEILGKEKQKVWAGPYFIQNNYLGC